MTSDLVTVLESVDGPLLAKRIQADGSSIDYDRCYEFLPQQVPVDGIAKLGRLLQLMQPRPTMAIVRGELVTPPDKVTSIRRLGRADNDDPATLRACAREWIALDLDSWPLPDGADVRDIPACGHAAVSMLPAAFQGIACLVQATAGHALKEGMRLRLWFWLSRPTTDAECKRWLRNVAIDASLFSATQLHYTAAPVFEGGRVEHLPERLVFLSGGAAVLVPSADELAPVPRSETPSVVPEGLGAHYVVGALKNAYSRIAGAEEGGRHAAILKASAGLARFVGQGHLGEPQFRRLIAAAAA